MRPSGRGRKRHDSGVGKVVEFSEHVFCALTEYLVQLALFGVIRLS